MVAARGHVRSSSGGVTLRHQVPRRVGGVLLALGLATAPLSAAAPARADASSQWALSYLKYSQVNALSTGSGVTIGLIDTGVQPIPNIAGQLTPGADYTYASGSNSVGNGEADLDPESHGNEMASVISGQGQPVQGFAPQSKIMPIRNLLGLNAPSGADATAKSIEYAISQHVQVINISQAWLATASEQAAIADAVNANIVVVVSAGNSGTTVSSDPQPAPAIYPGIVVVGAVDQSGAIASFSDSGPQVTLTAPGVNILVDQSIANDTANATGTSPAAAYVSATAALIFSAHPSWTAGQVIRDLITTADPGPGQTAGQHDDHYGYGIVDPLKALQASAPAQTTNPLLAAVTTAPTTSAATPSSTMTSATSTPTASSSSGSGSLLIVIGIVVVLAVIVIAFLVLRRGRNGRGSPPVA
jgi:subtilisin family serine protease